MKIQASFLQLLRGRNLTESQSQSLFREIFLRRLPESKTKAVLQLLVKKGESIGEITGCLKALRSLEPPRSVRIPHLLDTCGTGGDGSSSVNVSTLAALVIAGAGGKVAKHGNRGISSRCGSSDLMEALGVNLNAPAATMIASIKKNGIGYFHAPFHHPIFSHMQSLRKSLKTRTVFNLLGPLTNPLNIQYQLLGVARENMLDVYARVLSKMKLKNVLICHSADGMDEISAASPTDVVQVQGKQIKHFRINPKQFILRATARHRIVGGSADGSVAESREEDVLFSTSPSTGSGSRAKSRDSNNKKAARLIERNKNFALQFLKGKIQGPAADMIFLNAAAGLYVCGKAATIKSGIPMAREAVKTGRAYQALQGLIRDSHDF